MNRDHRWVVLWLLAGVIMVFVQMQIGAITRLTGSGLSITKWDIVTGTLPPLNGAEWDHAFELYRATPQYHQINDGMDLGQFKFIFFWEYVHRLWARLMGFVFLIPFIFFFLRKSLSRATLMRLALVITFAMLAALFGWIMVASGLINRPWVNAYKLTIHLALGASLFISIFYAWIKERGLSLFSIPHQKKTSLFWLFVLVILQFLLGGMLSGMKAALAFPTWPQMHNSCIPAILLDPAHWNMDNFLLYDKSGFMPALIQFLHRGMGYIIFIFVVLISIQNLQKPIAGISKLVMVLLGIVVVQVVLGILILVNSIGIIPVAYGTLHQAIAMILITFVFYLNIATVKRNNIA